MSIYLILHDILESQLSSTKYFCANYRRYFFPDGYRCSPLIRYREDSECSERATLDSFTQQYVEDTHDHIEMYHPSYVNSPPIRDPLVQCPLHSRAVWRVLQISP